MSWLSDVFQHGGPFFIVNTFFLAVVIGLIVERSIYFLGRGHLNAKAFLEQLRKLLSANNVDRAKKLCDATTAPVARVAKAGLNRLHRGEAAVAQAMEETMTDTLPEVKTRIGALWSLANITTLIGLLGTITGLIRTFASIGDANPADRQKKLSDGISEAMEETMTDTLPEVKTRIGALWSLANITTLIGLLGTITGLIRTFASIGDANPADRQKKLSDGISEAMYNTAFGLTIALICMVGHLLLSGAMKKVVADLEAFSLRFENLLADGGNTAATSRAPAAPTEDEDQPA